MADIPPVPSLKRLLPHRPFPPYAYRPGRTPHPTRDPDGHGYGHSAAPPAAPDPERWRACPDYLYGIDLFNHGYYWEAHEAWEGLWHACGRQGVTAAYLQGLINLAAAGLKARCGSARGMRANARKAAALFEAAGEGLGPAGTPFMGLDVLALAREARALATWSPARAECAARDSAIPFDVTLRAK